MYNESGNYVDKDSDEDVGDNGSESGAADADVGDDNDDDDGENGSESDAADADVGDGDDVDDVEDMFGVRF
ncbi:hypothetical protein ElyMa_006228900 [Elysia marginata]|uniref:Uncharacterized protein n=1 Tax=Elysia marginata TaxID=1093978 RepID=A0AAV4H5R4_9GAST|nr:hypothetical protein ElyMa_006228900 [Elysia marginata]